MPTIDLLTIRMTPENIRLIEDEALSLFRAYRDNEDVRESWFVQYLPLASEGTEMDQYNLIADKLVKSGSWILQLLQCYRYACRYASLLVTVEALAAHEGVPNPYAGETAKFMDGVEQYELRRAKSPREVQFFNGMLSFCKTRHRSGMGIYICMDGVEKHLAPIQDKAYTTSKQTTGTAASAGVRQVRDCKEKEIFENYYSKIQQSLVEHPMDVGANTTAFDFSLTPYKNHANQYAQRMAAQAKQRISVKNERTAQWSAKETKANVTFHSIAWVFFALAVVVKLLLVTLEPITIFTYIPIVGIDILYGLVVGWVGKISDRSRKCSIIPAVVEAIVSVIAMLIVALSGEGFGVALLVQLCACWIPFVAALITRGKDY